MQKGNQPSQTCSGGHIKLNPTQNQNAHGQYELD